MRVPFLPLLLLIIICVAIDWYICRRTRCFAPHKSVWAKLQIISIPLGLGLLLGGIFIPAKEGADGLLLVKMWMLFSFLSIYFAKISGVLFDLIASIPMLFSRRRISALTILGIAAGIIVFCAMWWGALVNRFRIQTIEVEIPVKELPEAFEGYRIAQISDLHVGTFGNDTSFVARLVDEVNASNPDLIVFTGDIVNRRSREFEPFTSVLSRLSAPDGVYAILGNHDYGDYMHWDSESDKKANMRRLYSLYDFTGMRLLRNETQWLHRAGDSIALIGVENIGDPPFRVYGSLTHSYPALNDSATKILLSHNPAHWTDSIASNKDINVALTLSGHTHAMQIEIAGASPAVLRYPKWGGLYADEDSTHLLYVNIGAGTVGMPMRIGATPEITLLTLRRK